jgi:hypothetical protein
VTGRAYTSAVLFEHLAMRQTCAALRVRDHQRGRITAAPRGVRCKDKTRTHRTVTLQAMHTTTIHCHMHRGPAICLTQRMAVSGSTSQQKHDMSRLQEDCAATTCPNEHAFRATGCAAAPSPNEHAGWHARCGTGVLETEAAEVAPTARPSNLHTCDRGALRRWPVR